MLLRGKQASGLLTQQKMLRAAVKLFLEKRYEGTTTAEIARAAGMPPSSFFRAFPSKEALLLELDKRMFSGQFTLAEQHSAARALRGGDGHPAPHRRADRAAARAVRDGLHVAVDLGIPVSQHGEAAGGHLRGRSSGRGGQGLLRDGDRLDGHDALVRGRAVRHVLYRGAQDRALFGVRAQALQCAARAAAGAENNWESWTIFDGTNLNLSDGSYYLGGNVTISGEITISGAVTFDLNGYTLTCNAADEDMFCVYDGKTLTIKDSGTDGTIDGQNKNCGFSVSSGTLILESSIIANCRDDYGDGGAVDIGKDCVFTMRGGTISNCNAQHEGGAI